MMEKQTEETREGGWGEEIDTEGKGWHSKQVVKRSPVWLALEQQKKRKT